MSQKFGTLQGVYIPNILQMIGVILFMRLSLILAEVGIFQMGLIMTLSFLLLLITSLSMASIASNMKIRGGGCYYMISRVLGLELGSAIGLLLCLSQLASTALCVTGFAISVNEFFPAFSIPVLKIGTTGVLFLTSYFSTRFAMRAQILTFVILCVAMGAIFLGSDLNAELPSFELSGNLGFWMGFALFFPAMTGMESGMAMSGDLKNPARSLTLGTIGAICTVYLLYLAVAFFLNANFSPEVLLNPFLFHSVSQTKEILMLGVWAVALASALGAILGAPRTIQAIAKDGILPAFLAKGPKEGTLVMFALTLLLTLTADMNEIIPMLTMICLVTYALVNFIAFFESLIKSPGWRPTLQIPLLLSFLGGVGCLAAMFLIHSGAAALVIALVFGFCFLPFTRKVQGNWEDIRYSIFSYLVQKATVRLSGLEKSAKSWRPHILAFFGSSQMDPSLAFFSHALNQEKGFLTFAAAIPTGEDSKKTVQSLKEHLKQFHIPSHIHVNASDERVQTQMQIVKNYGFGHLRPNTVIFPIEQGSDLIELLLDAHTQEKNVILLKADPLKMDLFTSGSQKKQIDLWWRGKYSGNFELCLALAYLLQQSKLWPRSKISIKIIAKDEAFKERLASQIGKYKSRLRIRNLDFLPVIDAQERFVPNLLAHSGKTDLTFIGLRKPETATAEEYKQYYLKLLEDTQGLSNVAYVLAGEKIKFRKIFL